MEMDFVCATPLHFPSGKFLIRDTAGGIGVPNPNKFALDENQFFDLSDREHLALPSFRSFFPAFAGSDFVLKKQTPDLK